MISWLSAVTSEVSASSSPITRRARSTASTPGLGELTGAPVNEDRAEFNLEFLDVRRDVRLHGRERVRRGGERAMLGDRDQGV